MPNQTNGEALNACAGGFLSVVLSLLQQCICLSQTLDVLVVRGQLTVAADNSPPYLGWDVILLLKGLLKVALYDCLHKLDELASEMVGSFFGHLSWEVVHAVEQNFVIVCFAHIANFLFEFVSDWVIQQEWIFDGGEPACELDGAALVGRDVSDAHQLVSAVFDCLPQTSLERTRGYLGSQ